jgi:hypothetical protein
VRAREGRRVPRAEVPTQMAETVLSQGTARARARHQVLVHTTDDGDQAWYETERGVLPVGSEVLEEALAKGDVLRADLLEARPARVSVGSKVGGVHLEVQAGSDVTDLCTVASEEATGEGSSPEVNGLKLETRAADERFLPHTKPVRETSLALGEGGCYGGSGLGSSVSLFVRCLGKRTGGSTSGL